MTCVNAEWIARGFSGQESVRQLRARPWLAYVRGESRGEGYCRVYVHLPLVEPGREEVRSRVPSPVRCCRPSRCQAQGTRGVLGQRSGFRCLLVSRGPCDGCLAEQTV